MPPVRRYISILWPAMIKALCRLAGCSASQRQLDPVRSTESQPVLLHQDPRYISPDEKIAVDIEILPSSTLYRKGETLELVIKGKDIFTHPKMAHGYGVNEGIHTLYSGGVDDSHLLLPIIE